MGFAFASIDQLSDNAVSLTASSQRSSFPVANLQDDQISLVWRSDGNPGSVHFIMDFGEAKPVDGFALIGCNLTNTSTIRFRLSDTDPTAATGEIRDTGVMDAQVANLTNYNIVVYVDNNTFSARYCRVTIADATPDYLQAGRLWVGSLIRFSYGVRIGHAEEFVDLTTKERADGGHAWSDSKPVLRRFIADMAAITQEEYDVKIQKLARNRGTGRSILFGINSDASLRNKQTIWGTLDQILSVRSIGKKNELETFYTTRFVVTEQR